VELGACNVSETDVALQSGIKGNRSARKTFEKIVVLLHFHHLEKKCAWVLSENEILFNESLAKDFRGTHCFHTF
jgi:hypothetical protein